VSSNAQFRDALRLHLGDERYFKFISQGRKHRRLFWQEEALAQFFDSHPEHRLSGEQLAEALRVCEVHGAELQIGTAQVFEGCVDYTREFLAARELKFPHACLEPISTEGRPASEFNTSVWICSECRDVQLRRSKSRSDASTERTDEG
jgi:hypothetical protein